MDNPENLATLGAQDEEKQSKNTTQYALDTTMHKQTQITQIRHIEGNCYHVFLTYIFYISLFNMILLCP
jgi:hypothetical protein